MDNKNKNDNKNNNVFVKFLEFIHKYYIILFIVLFTISIFSFSIIYFIHSEKIENRFDKTLQNYEESMKTILTNILIIDEYNKDILTNSFQKNIDNTFNNKIIINNNISQNKTAGDLKLSFEVGFKMLESSISEIIKNANDFWQFWFAFLSIIMIVFTIIGFFLNNNILNQSREQLNIIEKEAKEKLNMLNKKAEDETEKLIQENNNKIQENNLFNLGIQAYNSKDFEMAKYYLTEVIKLNPKNYSAYNYGGNAKSNLGQLKDDIKYYEEAIKDYNEAIKLNPKFAEAYSNRGIAKSNLKNYEEAIKDYNEAIKLNPKFAEAYSNRGIAKSNLKNYEEAIKDYDEAIKLNPNLVGAYNNRGIAKLNLGQLKDDIKYYEGAIKDYDEAIRLNPKYAEAYNNRGAAMSDLGRKEEAIKDFATAYSLSNNDKLKKKIEERLIALAKQGYKSAIEFCQKHNIDYENKN